MDNLATVLVSASVGFAGSALLMYIRDIYLHARRIKEQHRHIIIERQLENLYSPLYLFVKSTEFLFKERTIKLSEKEKVIFDSIIERYLYLAEDSLMVLLPRIHGIGYDQKENKEINDQVVELILRGYEKLRREYFASGGISMAQST